MDFILTWVVMPLLVLGLIMTFLRLLLGPKLPNRIAALDLLSVFGIGLIAVYAVLSEQPVFIDVAAVLALVSFLGTVALAAYIERRT